MSERVYILTAMGKKLDPRRLSDPDASRALSWMRDNGRMATESELEVAGGRHAIRALKNSGLIRVSV